MSVARFALKLGRVFNLYSEPIDDPNNPPDAFHCGTERAESEEEFKARFPGIRVVSRQAPPTTVVPSLPDSVLVAQMSKMQISPEDQKKILEGKVPSSAVASAKALPVEQHVATHTEIGKVYAENDLQEKSLQEFKLLLAKYFANTKDANSKFAVQCVGSFLLRLWPDLRDRLEEAKTSFEEPEFKL